MWHAALLQLNNDGWPRNQGVSVGSIPLSERHLSDGRRIIEQALVDEISITSTPAIPGAKAARGHGGPRDSGASTHPVGLRDGDAPEEPHPSQLRQILRVR
jgi:hypothetical protein